MRKLILFGSFIFSASLAHAQATRCMDVHDDITARELRNQFLRSEDPSGKSARQVILEMESIPLELISGKQSPKWLDFEKLEIFTFRLKQSLEDIRRNEGDQGLQKFYSTLNRASLSYSRSREIGIRADLPENMKYSPGEYGLRLSYRKQFEKLNHLLPSQLRYVLQPLPADPIESKLKTEAVQLVAANSAALEKLYPTSGYSNSKELIETVRSKGNVNVQKALDMVLNEEVEFAIARPDNARWWIPKVGFHNQYVTGTSKGFNDARVRHAMEASRLGMTREVYEKYDHTLKPKYGWLLPKMKSGKNRVDVHYGSDYFILDKNKLRDRTTWTPGDSLNSVMSFDMKIARGMSAQPTHWDQLFVPWAERALMAPLLQHHEEIPLRPHSYGTQASFAKDAPPLNLKTFGAEYLELQFWGPLTLEDVKAFVFIGTPPSGEFLTELQRRQIPIFQTRPGSPVYQPWNPPRPQ